MTDQSPAPIAQQITPKQLAELTKYARAGCAAEKLLKDLVALNSKPDAAAFKQSLALFITQTARALELELLEDG